MPGTSATGVCSVSADGLAGSFPVLIVKIHSPSERQKDVRHAPVRLCPSWPGLAPPGFDFSRCSLRSVEGGFEDVREVFSGRCRRSTKSISSSLLRRSRSRRPIPPFNQSKQRDARAWVIAGGQHASRKFKRSIVKNPCSTALLLT